MQDFVPLGSGNSRFLKTVNNAKTLYPTYDAFLNALVAGNLPIDLNGINAAGVAQMGTPLNKQNLLQDATAAALGLSTDASVNDALNKMATNVQVEETNVQIEFLGEAWTEPAKWIDASINTSYTGYQFIEFAGRWYAFQNGPVSEYVSYVSDDLKTWTKFRINSSFAYNFHSAHVIGSLLVVNCLVDTVSVCFVLKDTEDPLTRGNWDRRDGPPYASEMYSDGTYLYAWNSGVYSGITLYRCTDDLTWEAKGTINRSNVEMFTEGCFGSDGNGTLLAVGRMYVGYPEYGYGGVYVSHDWGATWSQSSVVIGNDGQSNWVNRYVTYNNGYFYITQGKSGYTSGIIRKTADGVNVEQLTIPQYINKGIYKCGDYWYSVGLAQASGSTTWSSALFKSSDVESWELVCFEAHSNGGVYGTNDMLFTDQGYMSKNAYEYRYELMFPNGELNTEKVASALGLPGAKIETGSYVGTGAYGSSNPNRLTFSFEPKLVAVIEEGTWTDWVMFIRGASRPAVTQTYNSGRFGAKAYCSWSKNGVTWYSESTIPNDQGNESGRTYYYVAIG